MSDTAAQAIADVEARPADLDDLTGEEIVDLAIGKPAGRQVRTGEHTYVIKEN